MSSIDGFVVKLMKNKPSIKINMVISSQRRKDELLYIKNWQSSAHGSETMQGNNNMRLIFFKEHRFWWYFCGLFFLCIFLWACQSSHSSLRNKTMQTELHFGVQGVEDFRRNQSILDNNYLEPVGMGFKDLDWKDSALGQVRIYTAESHLDIPNVSGAMGTAFDRKTYQGIHGIDVMSRFYAENGISLEQTYQAYANVVNELKKNKWQQFYYASDARIAPQDNLKYMLNKPGNSIDPTSLLSFEQWQQLLAKGRIFSLEVYNSDVKLIIIFFPLNLQRSSNEEDVTRENSRFNLDIDYAFTTLRYSARNMVGDDGVDVDNFNEDQYKIAFQKYEEEEKKHRLKAEQEAIAEGYQIDENYQDPDYWKYSK